MGLVTNVVGRRIQQLQAHLVGAVFEDARRRFGAGMIDVARGEFRLWRSEHSAGDVDDGEEGEVLPAEVAGALESMFSPWFCFTWVANPVVAAAEHWPEVPLGLDYLRRRHAELEADECQFLEVACGRPFSFYAVQEVVPGHSLHVRCLFTGCEYAMLERPASLTATQGSLLFARIVPMDGVAVSCGCASSVLPPRAQACVASFREEVRRDRAGPEEAGSAELSEEDLGLLDLELRELYIDLLTAGLGPSARKPRA